MNKLNARKIWFLLLATAGLGLVLVIGLVLSNRKPKHEVFFRMCFPSSEIPQSYRPVAYGDEGYLFGNDLYILAFSLSSADLASIMRGNGFTQVPIEPDSMNWGMRVCNDIISLILEKYFTGNWGLFPAGYLTITPQFECYSKETATNSVRVFYDPKNEVAITIYWELDLFQTHTNVPVSSR